VFLHRFGFNYSYTIESSFGLYRGKRVNEEDMLKVGEDILSSVVDFANMLVESKEKCFIVAPLKEILTCVKH
jgi:allophanate hydrolase subunit 2